MGINDGRLHVVVRVSYTVHQPAFYIHIITFQETDPNISKSDYNAMLRTRVYKAPICQLFFMGVNLSVGTVFEILRDKLSIYHHHRLTSVLVVDEVLCSNTV
jgi:hypothetical protein